jgi:hypothetical protein
MTAYRWQESEFLFSLMAGSDQNLYIRPPKNYEDDIFI